MVFNLFRRDSLNFLFMGEREKEPKISALPLRHWLAKQGRGSKAALARKLNIDHGRLTNWLRRGIPDAQVYTVAIEMGMSYTDYLALVGALPPNAKPTEDSPETNALLADFERLPAGLKSHIAHKTAELRALYESLPTVIRVGLKTKPDPATYEEWERGIEELMAKYKKEEK